MFWVHVHLLYLCVLYGILGQRNIADEDCSDARFLARSVGMSVILSNITAVVLFMAFRR